MTIWMWILVRKMGQILVVVAFQSLIMSFIVKNIESERDKAARDKQGAKNTEQNRMSKERNRQTGRQRNEQTGRTGICRM